MIKTKTPEWIADYVVGNGMVEYAGEEYAYHVVRGELGPKHGMPSLFAMARGGVIAVSDTYPVEYRTLGLIHEIHELVLNHDTDECACLRSLQVELQIAKERGMDMVAYIRFRTTFFQGLVDCYEKKERVPLEDALLVSLKHSLDHLKSIV